MHDRELCRPDEAPADPPDGSAIFAPGEFNPLAPSDCGGPYLVPPGFGAAFVAWRAEQGGA